MATCQEVITPALRKLSKVYEGQPAPIAYDSANALEVLNSLFEETFSRGLFGRLTDVLIEEDYTAGENERIINDSDADVVVTLPGTIDADEADERAPYDLSVVVVAADTPQFYIYEANKAAWITAYDLSLDDYCPLSSRGRHGLACWLAARLADEYGAEIGPATLREAARFHGALAIKFDSARQATETDFF